MRRRAALVLFSLAGAAALLAVWALATGGFRTRVLGVPLSVRGEHRAALVALALAAAGFLLLDQDRLIQRRSTHAVRHCVVRAARGLALHAPLLLRLTAAAAAAVVLAAGIRYGVRSAGSSDPSGYVSAAALWRAGQLRIVQDFARRAEWPNADGTFTPLAYRPTTAHTIVPVVAPGLPLIMAAAHGVAGSCGPFVVGPMCAALLVGLTYLLGVRMSNAAVGAMAALGVAFSPTVWFMSMSAMSDVPAAAFWTAALFLASRGGRISALAAGAAAGVAIMIRANLAPLVVFPAAFAIWVNRDGGLRSGVARAGCVAAGCAPFVVALAFIFNHLYGSPLESGYGPTSELFTFRNFLPNVQRYPLWLWETQGPVPFLSVAAPLVAAGQLRRPAAWLSVGFIAGVFVSYVFYEPFDAWWYLRFLLPAFPLVFVLAFHVVWHASVRLGTTGRTVLTALLTSAVVWQGISRTWHYGIEHLADGEQKYADAARFAATYLPANAIVLSMQHSGSVRLYSARPVLRYDLLDAAWLDRALAHVRAKGLDPYFLGEEWELEIFRARFGADDAVTGRPIAELPAHRVVIYALDGTPNQSQPAIIPRTSGCETAAKD